MKRQHSAGYFSNYDRGLNTLLDMWPAIHKALPDATLDIYYGWEVFDGMSHNNPSKNKLKSAIIRKLNRLSSMGVVEHGRVGHKQLAQAMKEITVWLYPTEYQEIFCITAVKTTAAKMNQVCTNVGALNEITNQATFIDSKNIYSDKEAQKLFIDEAINALKKPKVNKPSTVLYWPDVATRWDSVIKELQNK